MLSPTTYTIRMATPDDDAALRQLAELDSQAPLTAAAVLVGEIHGDVQAAVSLADGRVIANPFLPTGQLLAHLRLRAAAASAVERTPSVSVRIRQALAGAVLARPAGASA